MAMLDLVFAFILGVFTFCIRCIQICLVCFVASFKLSLCDCCWLTVCIVVVVLCALLSYAYLLYYVGIAIFYFRCRTAS